MIEINKVVKSFHHKEVLNIEQLTIHKGETVAVMGMNGAGKSTLIKLISGLFNQDQGTIFVDGLANTDRHIHQKVKFVLESGRGYYDYLTAMQNIHYFLKLNQLSVKQVQQEMLDYFEWFDFTPYQNTLVSELSQGNRQKLSLIIALLCQPEILCLDEPTNGLDVVSKRRLGETLAKIQQKRDLTIIMTTHDFTFTKEFASRILIMNQGKLTKDGSFTQLFGREQDWLSYHFTCPLESKSALQAKFPKLHFEETQETIQFTCKEETQKDEILRNFKVLSFKVELQDMDDILYEVIAWV